MSSAQRLGVVVVLCGLARPALGAYSAPLTRVRIDETRSTQTPSVFYAKDERNTAAQTTTASAAGAQYLGQWEWASGYGVQLGAAVGRLELALRRDGPGGVTLDADGTGQLIGAQVRAYTMLWSGHFGDGAGRAHALSGFLNLRAIRLQSTSGGRRARFDSEVTTAGAGAGLMAELALSDYLSVCPYAWFSPSLIGRRRFVVPGAGENRDDTGPSLAQPLRVGVDAWLYPSGDRSESHLALSFIASLLDTTGNGSNEVSVVLGYSF